MEVIATPSPLSYDRRLAWAVSRLVLYKLKYHGLVIQDGPDLSAFGGQHMLS